MVFIVIPDNNSIIDWISVINKLKFNFKNDFKDIYKINFYRLEMEENKEESIFNIFVNILSFDKKTDFLKPLKNKQYKAHNEKDIDALLQNILVAMDTNDSICIINHSMYKKINKFLENTLDVIEYKIDGELVLYIKSSINISLNIKSIKRKENNYAIHSLHAFRR